MKIAAFPSAFPGAARRSSSSATPSSRTYERQDKPGNNIPGGLRSAPSQGKLRLAHDSLKTLQIRQQAGSSGYNGVHRWLHNSSAARVSTNLLRTRNILKNASKNLSAGLA